MAPQRRKGRPLVTSEIEFISHRDKYHLIGEAFLWRVCSVVNGDFKFFCSFHDLMTNSMVRPRAHQFCRTITLRHMQTVSVSLVPQEIPAVNSDGSLTQSQTNSDSGVEEPHRS